jgi:hypothetical protein
MSIFELSEAARLRGATLVGIVSADGRCELAPALGARPGGGFTLRAGDGVVVLA